MKGQMSLFDFLPNYDTLPNLCGRYECMMRSVKYIGKGDGHFRTGEECTALWKAQTDHKGNIYGFEVDVHRIVSYNRNGKSQGYILVKQYRNPFDILKDWDFQDLRNWSNELVKMRG